MAYNPSIYVIAHKMDLYAAAYMGQAYPANSPLNLPPIIAPFLTGTETPIFSEPVSTVNRLRKNRSLLFLDVMFANPQPGFV